MRQSTQIASSASSPSSSSTTSSSSSSSMLIVKSSPSSKSSSVIAASPMSSQSQCHQLSMSTTSVGPQQKQQTLHRSRPSSSSSAWMVHLPLKVLPTMLSHCRLSAFAVFMVFLCSFALSVSGCSQCEQRAFEEYKQARQEQILKDLLKKLELPSKPNVTVDYDSLRYIAPRNPRIQALIEQSRREKANNDHRRVRKSIQQWRRRNSGEGEMEEGEDYFPALYETEQEQPAQTSYILAQGSPGWFDQDLPTAIFKFSSDLRKKFVTAARLNIFLHRPEQLGGFGPIATRLNVYQRFANGTLGPKLVSKHLELNFDETTAYEQVELEFGTMLVQEWIETGPQFEELGNAVEGGDAEGEGIVLDEKSPPSIVGLYVEALHQGENLVQYPLSPTRGDLEEEEEQTATADALMFFELEMVNLKSGRSRRNSNVCRPGSNHTKCCLYDLVIDFEKIGWSFVIAPKRYNAYVCSGECTGMGNGNALGRAQAAAAAKIDHFQCCHPKEYNGITILFVQDNNNVLIREVPNMVAKDCGCT